MGLVTKTITIKMQKIFNNYSIETAWLVEKIKFCCFGLPKQLIWDVLVNNGVEMDPGNKMIDYGDLYDQINDIRWTFETNSVDMALNM